MSHSSSVPPSRQTNHGGNKPHLPLLACSGIIQGTHLSPTPRRLLLAKEIIDSSQAIHRLPKPSNASEARNSAERRGVDSTDVNKEKMGIYTFVHLLGTGSGKRRNSVPRYGGNLSWRLAPGKANLQENHFCTVKWSWELGASDQAFMWAPIVSRLGMSCVHSSPVWIFSKIEEHWSQNRKHGSSCTGQLEGEKDNISYGRSKEYSILTATSSELLQEEVHSTPTSRCCCCWAMRSSSVKTGVAFGF